MNLRELANPWFQFIWEHRMGRAQRQDFLDLLRSGEPIPKECNDFIADVFEGKKKFKTGVKKVGIHDQVSRSPMQRYLMRHMVSRVQAELEDENFDFHSSDYDEDHAECLASEARYVRNTGASARESAKAFVAKELYGISVRSLEKYIKQ